MKLKYIEKHMPSPLLQNLQNYSQTFFKITIIGILYKRTSENSSKTQTVNPADPRTWLKSEVLTAWMWTVVSTCVPRHFNILQHFLTFIAHTCYSRTAERFPVGSRLTVFKKTQQTTPPHHPTPESTSAVHFLSSISTQCWSVTASLLSGKHWSHHTCRMGLSCNLDCKTKNKTSFPQNSHHFCNIWIESFFLVTDTFHK